MALAVATHFLRLVPSAPSLWTASHVPTGASDLRLSGRWVKDIGKNGIDDPEARHGYNRDEASKADFVRCLAQSQKA